MKTYGSGPIPQIIRYKRRLEWPNGATCTLFSGEEPDQLRGPQAQLCYIDELAKMRYAQDAFDNAMFGLRLGDTPRMLISADFLKRIREHYEGTRRGLQECFLRQLTLCSKRPG
jgi:phage terminase large subunit-like protein